MKTTRPKYSDTREGRRAKVCARWYLDFRDSHGTRRRLPAYSDRRATDRLGQLVEEIMAQGGQLSLELQRKVEGLPDSIRHRLIDWQVIDGRRIAESIGKTLEAHLADFEKALLAKGDTEYYCGCKRRTIQAVFDGCGFKTWGDLDANRLYVWLHDQRGEPGKGIGQRTFNSHLQSVRQFAKWMIKERRATGSSPLEHLSPVRRTERRRTRRVLELAELKKFLAAAQDGPHMYGLSGPTRAILYKLAIFTGLRASEIESLTVGSFDWKTCEVRVEAAYSKRRRQDTLPLRAEFAAELRQSFAGKLPGARAFDSCPRLSEVAAELVQADLAAAHLVYVQDGRHFDFHALRHQCASLLAASGVDVKTCQSILRHSDVNLTLSVYGHALRGSEARAVAAMPDLSGRPGQAAEVA